MSGWNAASDATTSYFTTARQPILCHFSTNRSFYIDRDQDQTLLNLQWWIAKSPTRNENMLHFIWTIIIGFVAGLIARAVTPGDKGPQGFILTAILGIIGALAATYLGQAIGWYGSGENAGFIGAIVGAVLILLVWGFIDRRRAA